MSEELEEWIERQVTAAPPMPPQRREEMRAQMARILSQD
jgi:hypothetical protein